MLCRTSTLCHPATDVTISTPLLVPSFSSKGFARSRSGKSEIATIFAAASEVLTETVLISAYDVFYKNLPPPDEFMHRPELLFVDSGGYEVSTDRDYASVIDPLPQPRDWSVQRLETVIDGWPEHIPSIFVSYDHPEDRKSFAEQVKDARRLFRSRKQHLSLLLLKPETRTQRTLAKTIRAAVAEPEKLGAFDVVGVTEKELGNSMIDRMSQITRLRLAMDDAGVARPLHVFGALDPVSVPLYYLAGAEIFDGLTWIRYGYRDGLCVYTHNMGAVDYGVHLRDDHVRMRALKENYYYLLKLQSRMRDFETTPCFEKLGPHSRVLADAWDSLRARFRGRL